VLIFGLALVLDVGLSGDVVNVTNGYLGSIESWGGDPWFTMGMVVRKVPTEPIFWCCYLRTRSALIESNQGTSHTNRNKRLL